jgi:ubiquinone/menaquinone biosynthesis C-methylase UbiE
MSKKSEATQLDFTPAAPSLRLYDFLVAVLTRENTWRGLLLHEMQPRSGDRIADIGCGTAALIVRICNRVSPEKLIGIDPDQRILEMARAKTMHLPQAIDFRLGYAREAHEHLQGLGINKIVSSLVFHQVPLQEKRKGLESMYRALVPGGQLFIADYGLQRTPLMRKLFRIVQAGDGYENTQPNADGIMPKLIHEAGFVSVLEKHVIPTPSGSFSIYRAERPY